jgi:hypothetical protein
MEQRRKKEEKKKNLCWQIEQVFLLHKKYRQTIDKYVPWGHLHPLIYFPIGTVWSVWIWHTQHTHLWMGNVLKGRKRGGEKLPLTLWAPRTCIGFPCWHGLKLYMHIASDGFFFFFFFFKVQFCFNLVHYVYAS